MGNAETVNPDKVIYLNTHVSGCLSACTHCWALGHPYPPMKLDDIEWVLEKGAEFCQAKGIKFMPVPFHEVLTHPDALKLIRLFASYADERIFEPFITPGPLLAQRSDWEEILNGLKESGTTTLWFAFHGLDEVHDQIVNYEGAFKELIIAIERTKSVGLRCGTNLFLTTASAPQIPDVLQFFRNVGIDEFSLEVVGYYPHPRGRAFEALRPELDQLRPHAESILEATNWHKDFWSNLEQHTEAFYTNKAINQGPELTWLQLNPNCIQLFCRSNMDLHTGLEPEGCSYNGNLRTEDAQEVFSKAVNAWPLSLVGLMYPGIQHPSPSVVASKWGNPHGQKVYLGEWDCYMRLLDIGLGENQHEHAR